MEYPATLHHQLLEVSIHFFAVMFHAAQVIAAIYTYCGISVALPPAQNLLNFCPLIAALQKCLCHMRAGFKGSPLKHLCIYKPVQFKLLERSWHLHKTWLVLQLS